MNILVVADFSMASTERRSHPYGTSIEALAEAGTVDLFSFVDERQTDRTVPADVALRRLETAASCRRWVPNLPVPILRSRQSVTAVGRGLKILESFAHRVPGVSTTLGAAGLDVMDGVHLVLADDPDEFIPPASGP